MTPVVPAPPQVSSQVFSQVPNQRDQRDTWAHRYPVERPDFEPPPPWARPAPAVPKSASRPFGTLGTAEEHQTNPSEQGGWWLKRKVVLALAAAIAMVAASIGATVGVLATLEFGPALIATEPPPIDDELGAEGKAFPKPQSVSTVARTLLPSVVQIKVATGTGNGTGSGFVIRKDGYILTNNHVIERAARSGSIKVITYSGEELSGSVVGRSPAYDLAVIRVQPEGELREVALGDSEKVQVGEPVVALGSPLGLAGTVTTGIVSALNRPVTAGGSGPEISFINAIQTDAAVNPGNSGGPLVNLKAEVIGVNSAIATVSRPGPFTVDEPQGSIGLGFAIPMNQARRTADQIIRTGHAVYPVIGAELDMRHEGPGARLGEVRPGSAAEKSGLAAGDLVTMINGHKITGAEDLIVQIRRHLPGQRVELIYERGGEQRRAIVTLDQETG
jgi:putative serine protease PepD